MVDVKKIVDTVNELRNVMGPITCAGCGASYKFLRFLKATPYTKVQVMLHYIHEGSNCKQTLIHFSLKTGLVFPYVHNNNRSRERV